MVDRIMVPVDGSELSERAIPLAELLARTNNAEICLVRAFEPLNIPPYEPSALISPETTDELRRQVREHARAALDRLKSQVEQHGVRVKAELLQLADGSPASTLLDYEQTSGVDIVAMATHGRTGLARFALGSVADRILREGSKPVLLIRPLTEQPKEMGVALLPLDGSEVGERAIKMAEALAGRPLRSVRLLQAIEKFQERSAAMDYLQSVADRLAAAGLETTVYVSVGEGPVEAIRTHVADADIVVMATHGRGGIDRMRHGSVAEAAARELQHPVLLVRATSAS
ncbi:MAG: universal stress protein [Chloroflexi bacterium]|nr:universal stress protein [Chloroflexota bacterium]